MQSALDRQAVDDVVSTNSAFSTSTEKHRGQDFQGKSEKDAYDALTGKANSTYQITRYDPSNPPQEGNPDGNSQQEADYVNYRGGEFYNDYDSAGSGGSLSVSKKGASLTDGTGKMTTPDSQWIQGRELQSDLGDLTTSGAQGVPTSNSFKWAQTDSSDSQDQDFLNQATTAVQNLNSTVSNATGSTLSSQQVLAGQNPDQALGAEKILTEYAQQLPRTYKELNDSSDQPAENDKQLGQDIQQTAIDTFKKVDQKELSGQLMKQAQADSVTLNGVLDQQAANDVKNAFDSSDPSQVDHKDISNGSQFLKAYASHAPLNDQQVELARDEQDAGQALSTNPNGNKFIDKASLAIQNYSPSNGDKSDADQVLEDFTRDTRFGANNPDQNFYQDATDVEMKAQQAILENTLVNQEAGESQKLASDTDKVLRFRPDYSNQPPSWFFGKF